MRQHNLRSIRGLAQRGFTFLEIILVVAIIGILAGLVGPRIVGKSKSAKMGAAKAEIASLSTSLMNYEINVGDFPSTSQGLRALLQRPSDVDERDWQKVIDRMPKDPWGEEYMYAYPSTNGMDFDLSSKGPDRQEGTDDDISNWDDADSGGESL